MIFLVRSRLPVVCFPFAAVPSLKCQCHGKHPKAVGIALGATLELLESSGTRECQGWWLQVRDWLGHQAAGAESARGQLWGRQGSHPTGQPPHREQAQGHVQGAWVTPALGNAECWSQGMLWWNLSCAIALSACSQKGIWYSWRVSGAKATSRGKIWDVAPGSTAAPHCL